MCGKDEAGDGLSEGLTVRERGPPQQLPNTSRRGTVIKWISIQLVPAQLPFIRQWAYGEKPKVHERGSQTDYLKPDNKKREKVSVGSNRGPVIIALEQITTIPLRALLCINEGVVIEVYSHTMQEPSHMETSHTIPSGLDLDTNHLQSLL